MGKSKDNVALLIAQVKGVLDVQKGKTTGFFRSLEANCASGVAKLNESIKSNGDAITEATSQLNTWKGNLETATKDQKNAKEEIKKAKVQLKGLRKRAAKVTEDYQVFAAEADKKLNIVKVLRDIITDELINRSPTALVQVNKFQSKLTELKEMLNSNSDSLYTPIISVLLDLATEQNFSDQGILKKILQNLRNLDKALKDFRTKQEKGLDAELLNLKKQIKNVRQRVRAYRRMSHQASSKAIDARHYIVFYTHEIKHFNAEKKRMEEAKRFFSKLCDFQKNVHKKHIAGLKKFKKVTVPYLFSNIQKLN